MAPRHRRLAPPPPPIRVTTLPALRRYHAPRDRVRIPLATSPGWGATCPGSRVHHGAARFASARLARPADPSRPADLCSPTPAGTAAAPMFHRCRLDDTDVPSVLLRPHGPTARRRSAHTPTAASMTSRRTGPVVAGSACPALGDRGCPTIPAAGRGGRIPPGGARVTLAIMPQPGSPGPFPVIVCLHLVVEEAVSHDPCRAGLPAAGTAPAAALATQVTDQRRLRWSGSGAELAGSLWGQRHTHPRERTPR